MGLEKNKWCSLLLMLSAIAAACDDGGDRAVRPSVVLSGDMSSITDGSVVALNGTYSACLERSGSWSVRVSGNAALDHDPLSVISGDTGCVLAVTEVVADQTYTTSSPITLAASYQASVSAFVPSGGSTTAFYANAKLDSVSFSGNFVITLVHSGDPSNIDAGNVSATYATVQSSNQATIVPPPNYTISFTMGTAFTLQLDAAKTVTSASGNATLIDGSVTGTTYVIDQGTLAASPNYLAVQVAFLAGTPHAISGANPTIPASQFGLAGASLASPVVRTVIVGRLLGGVLGYELIKVTFRSP